MKIGQEEKEIIKDLSLDLRKRFKVDFPDIYTKYYPILNKVLNRLEVGEFLKLERIKITRSFKTVFSVENNLFEV